MRVLYGHIGVLHKTNIFSYQRQFNQSDQANSGIRYENVTEK